MVHHRPMSNLTVLEPSEMRFVRTTHEGESMDSAIEARGLTKRFGDTVALDGLDLVAPAGKVTAVLGPNGAGKTTFVRSVATLLRPDSGALTVAGIDAVRADRHNALGASSRTSVSGSRSSQGLRGSAPRSCCVDRL